MDILKQKSPKEVIYKEDKSELYQLYDKIFKQTDKPDTIYEFYIWLIENKCYILNDLLGKLDRIIGYDNPFHNDWYVLDAFTYLYNRKYIKMYPKNINILEKYNIKIKD